MCKDKVASALVSKYKQIRDISEGYGYKLQFESDAGIYVISLCST